MKDILRAIAAIPVHLAGLILSVAGLAIYWICSLIAGIFMICAAFSGLMFAFTRTPHDLLMAAGFLGYAVLALVVPTLLLIFRARIVSASAARRQLRAINANAITFASDANFDR